MSEGLGDIQVGDKIKFHEHRQAFKVQAVGERYVVLTKPMNALKTVLYTIIDREEGIRGQDNYGGLGYETPADCVAALAMLESGEASISPKNHKRLPLDIERVRKVRVQVGEEG